MKRVVDFVIKSELHIFNLFITTLECVEMDQLSRSAMGVKDHRFSGLSTVS